MDTRSVEETIEAAGAKLHSVRLIPPGRAARGVTVMVHGFSAHSELYRHVGMALCEAGLTVSMYDQRGHGRSEGKRGHIDRFSTYVHDLELVVKRAREQAPGLPLALVGHSMGATVILSYLLEGGGKADAVVLATPWLGTAVKVPWYKQLGAPLMSQLWPGLTLGNGLVAHDLSRNPDVIAGFNVDPLVHHVATPRLYTEVRAVQARVLAAAAALRVPTLMLVAGQDRIVSVAAERQFAQLAGSMVELQEYPELFHEVYLEPDAAQLVTDTAAWVFHQLSTPRSAVG